MRSPVAGVVLHDSDDLQPWRDAIGYAANQASVECSDAPIGLVLQFYLARGRTVRRPLPSVPPDLDKLARAVGDALEGIAWRNDAQVTHLTASKAYADEWVVPGVQISIEELT